MYPNDIDYLTRQYQSCGELLWIGVRPSRKQAVVPVETIHADLERGLIGDHYAGRSKKRQVTMMQWEHLAVLESFLGRTISPDLLRRNLLIRGINLLSLKRCQFQIGDIVFETTGFCSPCSRMEAVLGRGGYNAMRGHGGITTQILRAGRMQIGDAVVVLER